MEEYNHEPAGDESEIQLSPGLQALANLADQFDANAATSDVAREYSKPVTEQTTEELAQKIERLEGYDIYGPELEERLKRDEEAARINTLAMEADPNRSGSLILVCAKHPLIDGDKPGIAFKARLDEAILRYEIFKKKGERAVIRVPGAIHFGDNISLAEAGENYLIENGIPEEDISADGDEENGTDEVTHAYNIFEQGNYKQFHICCGENQVFRNKMACMEMLGFLPYFHTSTTLEDMPHQIGFEIGNPRGGLRFLLADKGVSVDKAAKERHLLTRDKYVYKQ